MEKLRSSNFNPGLIFIVTLFFVFVAYICFTLRQGELDIPAALEVPAIAGATLGLMLEIATSRVVASSVALRLINPLFITTIPLESVKEVNVDNGLAIVTQSGKTYESAAYGSSLLGLLLGYPRAARLERRLSPLVDSARSSTVGQHVNAPIARQIRLSIIVLPLSMAILVPAATLVLRAIYS